MFDVDPTFDPDDGRYHVSCDWQTVNGPGIVIVEAVARVLNMDPLDLQPLQDAVDVDSVESLLTSHHTAPVTVEFEYADTRVRLSRDGRISIDPQ
jgi:hypothetical protein